MALSDDPTTTAAATIATIFTVATPPSTRMTGDTIQASDHDQLVLAVEELRAKLAYVAGVPAGGNPGDSLIKSSAMDYALAWSPTNNVTSFSDLQSQVGTLSTQVASLQQQVNNLSGTTTTTPTLTNSAAPAITGTATVGSTLTASTGTWSVAPTTYSYAWRRSGATISGATSSTYTLVNADAGAAITVTVTASRSGYTSGSATSAATAAVTAATTPSLSNTALPVISGTAQVGQALTATSGSWSATPDSYAYAWRRAGAVISGATGSTYSPVAADVGSALSVTVTVAKSGYTGAAATSSATGVITAAATANVPTAPIALTVSASDAADATITWGAPTSNGGSAITGYVVARDGSDSTGYGAYSGTVSASTLTATFSSLISATPTTYHFTVAATNANGTGPAASVTFVSGSTTNTGGGGNTGGGSGTTTSGTGPSGLAMPTSSLTNSNGSWNLIHAEDFNTNAAAGSFLSTAPYSTWFDAYDGYGDTSRIGTYNAAKTISASGGSMLIRLFSEGNSHWSSAPNFRAAAGQSYGSQVYGRYSYAMRVVAEAGDISGWAVAHMLWPNDDVWPAHGETDFPETSLGSGARPGANMHYASSGGGQDQFSSNASIFSWHTYTIEWGPGFFQFFVDGVSIGRSTQYISTYPMRWNWQSETAYGSTPAAGAIARIEIDWAAIWSRS